MQKSGKGVVVISATAIAIKAAMTIVGDKRLRTISVSIIVGIIGGFVILIGTMFSIIQGSQESNQKALGYIFNTYPIDISLWDLPIEYRDELTVVKSRVSAVIDAADDINGEIEGTKIDTLKAGAVYLCLFPNGEVTDYTTFAWCFAKKEIAEDYEMTVIITDDSEVYSNIQDKFGITITTEQIANITQIYHFLTTGGIFTAPYEDDVPPPGEAYSNGTFARLMGEATKYIGFPYVFGGSTPQTSFDCSGFICYVFSASGVYNLPRMTAQGIYNQCAPITESEAKPGDLVFFHSTYNCPDYITHLGIYVGEGKFLHAGNPIGYSTFTQYWINHFVGYGRLN